MKSFFVYILQKPTDEICKFQEFTFSHPPFYVGKGYRDISYDRLYNSIREGNSHKMNIIKKYGKIEITCIECETEEIALNLEKKLIESIGRKDLGLGPLCNLTDGGDGMTGSKALCRKIAQYSKEGNLIKTFSSIQEAEISENASNLSRACSKKMLACGYFWRKYDIEPAEKIEVASYFENRMHNGNKPRKIEAYKDDKIFFFLSIKEASLFTKVYPSTIIRSTMNKKTYNGYTFRYKD